MRVKCVICDRIDNIDDYNPLAKKLRNRPIHTYTCPECYERITVRTNERKATGNFKLFESKKTENDW
ncbi:YlaI family protein [Bacillus sp. FJAT-45350]|uniref:YlaI family protein n=1 Tax=Bacillus sp. FJAT-45350 TaxID=2011014 RepID=UPI000BB88986|nr:YlaI family protein [Bacillus sp. FJAT-45350]